MPRRRPFRNYDDAFAWLASNTNYETMATQRYDERTYGLARVERLLREAGQPDRAFDVAQVLGSKGKGSTATALAQVLRASGRRVGLFTSPHLVDPRERIVVDGEPAPDAEVCDALGSLVPHVEAARARGEPSTFFEIHTVAALIAFRALRCDAVVLEAGMGGRLDATSAARAKVKVVTSISLDHTQHLGRTLAAIAAEKAAAARRGVPLVSGESVASAAGRVIARCCESAGAPLLAIGRDFRVERTATAFDASTGLARTTLRLCRDGAPALDLEIPLLGLHQARNAALAAVAALTPRWEAAAVRPEHVREGLARTRIRARLETVSRRPLVIVDGAHNPASLRLLGHTVRDAIPHRRAVFVVGMAADKDVRGSLRALKGVADLVVATTSGQPRAASPEDLARIAREAGLVALAAPDLRTALVEARRRCGRDDAIVVTGSLYLCGAFLSLSAKGRAE